MREPLLRAPQLQRTVGDIQPRGGAVQVALLDLERG